MPTSKSRWLLRPTIATVLLLVTLVAYGEVPGSINYQAYLTNPVGQPINDTLEIDFRIYDTNMLGVPLWSEIQTVPTIQGLFSVRLGSIVNPFPADLFEEPLWLGISIDGGTELEPRRALTSVGFAFKSDDADTLQGFTPESLDQSAAVIALQDDVAALQAQVNRLSDISIVNALGNSAATATCPPGKTVLFGFTEHDLIAGDGEEAIHRAGMTACTPGTAECIGSSGNGPGDDEMRVWIVCGPEVVAP